MGFTTSKRWRLVDIAVSLLVLIALIMGSQTSLAYGLESAKCTARPNGDTGSEVYGGKGTRVTWEGQAAEDESVKAVALAFPEGTEFSVDDARLTILTGADHMTRVNLPCEFSAEGQAILCDFSEAAAPGSYIRIEVYDVMFPAAGGDMQLTGTYETADGATREISGIQPIPVAVTSPTDQLSRSLEEQPWVQAWNSNKFLRLFLNPPILVSSFPVVFNGFLMAIAIVAVAYPLAIPIGLLLALMRMARLRILRAVGSLYVNVVRGTPMFLQIYIAFFGLPLAGVQIPPFILGVIVLSMNSAAYLCEIFRAGIQSISKGQFEAARSLGMTGAQTMIHVIIPQTVRRVLPTMTNEFILLYKDTSLLAAVGVMEVVMYAKTIVASTGSITPYVVAACFYLVITIPLAKLVGNLEARLAGKDSGSGSRKARKGKGAKGGSADVPAVAQEALALADAAGTTDVTAVSQPRGLGSSDSAAGVQFGEGKRL